MVIKLRQTSNNREWLVRVLHNRREINFKHDFRADPDLDYYEERVIKAQLDILGLPHD